MKRLTLLMIVVMSALVHRSDGQQAASIAQQLKLSSVMPRGAMVYVQAGDLSALMKTWLSSPVRSNFYASPSFAAFQKSRVYLKLQDRAKDFGTAIGVGLDENRLAELAGRASAVSIYDIGNLEMVFVTEVPRARAVASALFKQAPQFQERSADGTAYYVRDVTTDGGRLNQQFCFAHVDGKLIVTTTEGLMIRAISNAKSGSGDSLAADVLSLADAARGFAAHDVTMWLDQARLNRNRYFNNYWIHENAESGLATIQSALIDLRVTREGMTEQRWFRTAGGSKAVANGSLTADQVSSLMRYATADAQLIEISAAGDAGSLASPIETTLFGRLPEQTSTPPEIPDRTRRTASEDSGVRAERYSRLDARFDIDADDEQAPARGNSAPSDRSRQNALPEPIAGSFAGSIAPILRAASNGAYCELSRSRTEAGKPFVRFERALVTQLKAGASLNREALEKAIIDELRARFVVAGTQPKLGWQDLNEVRFVAQSLLEQGAAYAISRDYLVLASSKEFASDILQAAKAPTVEKTDAPVQLYAALRVAAAKPVFDTLMSKLDGGETNASSGATSDNEEEHEVKFFSENLSSLIAASSISEMRLTRQADGVLMTERIVYLW